jgi:hypothetical protein
MLLKYVKRLKKCDYHITLKVNHYNRELHLPVTIVRSLCLGCVKVHQAVSNYRMTTQV